MSSQLLQSKILELAEKQQDQLMIDDFKVPVIEMMLKFTYDQTLDLGEDFEFIEQLLLAAGKYGVEKLKFVLKTRFLESM
jgi:hypothetical protein